MQIDPAAKWITIPRERMKRAAKIVFTLLLIVAAIGCALLWLAPPGPLYKGRRTADWVAQALRDESRSEAFEAVLQIGAPAVPFIARRGLHDKCHTFHFLAWDHVDYFCTTHPWLSRWLGIGRWVRLDNCVGKHDQARWLLFCMGTNAQAAIPDVIDCLEHCPALHVMHHLDLLDTLGEISGTNPAAIPFLARLARNGDLRAAAVAYYIHGQTNLLVETCQLLARRHPDWLLSGQELFWFREDHELNQHLVPLLERLYADPRLESRSRDAVMFELESRSNDATAAIARLRPHRSVRRLRHSRHRADALPGRPSKPALPRIRAASSDATRAPSGLSTGASIPPLNSWSKSSRGPMLRTRSTREQPLHPVRRRCLCVDGQDICSNLRCQFGISSSLSPQP